jgi:hypothetical protein
MAKIHNFKIKTNTLTKNNKTLQIQQIEQISKPNTIKIISY